MSSTPLAPVRVSPFIKLARWSLLLAGIWYGSTRWNYLHRKEEKYRAHLAELRPALEAEAAAKKKLEAEQQGAELAAQGIDMGPLA